MQYANSSLFQSAWSTRWVGFTASVHLSAGSLIAKTFQELKYFYLIGGKKIQFTETLGIAAVPGY